MTKPQIVERYYFGEEESAEYGDTEEVIGYAMFKDGVLFKEHGLISEYWIDKNGVMEPDGTITSTDSGKPEYKKPTVEERERKRRTTKGDQISRFEHEDGLGKEKF